MASLKSEPVRNLARNVLPKSVRQLAAYPREYLRRLSEWRMIEPQLEGLGPDDVDVLKRSIRQSKIRSLRELYRWRDPQLVDNAEIRVKNRGVFAIRASSDDLGHVLPQNTAELLDTVERFLKPGDIAFDAGANIGAITVMMAKAVGATGRVIAVEMMPDTANCLRRNINLNNLENVTVVENALSDKTGEIVKANVAEGLFGQASISPEANVGNQTQSIEVKTVTLDQIAEGIESVALMKMDLEGAEPMALRGAESLLKHTRAIVFESWTDDGGPTAAILREAGFHMTSVDNRNFLATRD